MEQRIDDLDAMEPYIAAVARTIDTYGGRDLDCGGDCEVQEGRLGELPIKVSVTFSSNKAADTSHCSAEHQAILPYRMKKSVRNFVWLTGEQPRICDRLRDRPDYNRFGGMAQCLADGCRVFGWEIT